MKLVTATDVWYTQQQKTLDEIAEKLGVVAYRPSYHGAERDKNTVLFYLKEDEEHNREVDRQPVRYSRSEAKDRGVNVNSECVYQPDLVLRRERAMANKPVLGIIDCPHCGRANMVGWNGNYKVPCFYCKKKFMVKRTRLHHTTPITVNENAKEAIER